MWLKAEGFVELVKQWWDSYQCYGTPCYVLANKLKKLKDGLFRWNKEVFGVVEVRKRAFLEAIQSIDGLVEEGELTAKEREEGKGEKGFGGSGPYARNQLEAKI
jgi:hypothetical protein